MRITAIILLIGLAACGPYKEYVPGLGVVTTECDIWACHTYKDGVRVRMPKENNNITCSTLNGVTTCNTW